MSDPRSEPDYYRSKASHMRRLANQAQNETARGTYLLLEASWLRLAESSEKKAAAQQTGRDGAEGLSWQGGLGEAGDSEQPAG